MTMGRPPIPTAIKKQRGTYRADRAPANEPQPDDTRPICPTWLADGAKTVWRYLIPILHDAGLVTKADRYLAADYCEWVWLKQQAIEAMQRDGNNPVIKTTSGNYVQNPWVLTSKQASTAMRKIESELGIGAGSRTRISVDKPDKPLTLEEELFGLPAGK